MVDYLLLDLTNLEKVKHDRIQKSMLNWYLFGMYTVSTEIISKSRCLSYISRQ